MSQSAMAFSLDFPLAYGAVTARASFRMCQEDFQVVEELGFSPIGSGEHVYLWVEKRGENTAWLSEQIARLAGVKIHDVGYAGRKDRHAVTRQWFSVYLPQREGYQEPDWGRLNSDSVTVLDISRHSRKLRKGEHQGNRFVIGLRQVQFSNSSEFVKKLDVVLATGVPNYFGEQRFGHYGNNLREAQRLLIEAKPYRDKQKRGLILSAARSYLFNQVLAGRVLADNWQLLIPGDPSDQPTGPLWGRGRSLAEKPLQAFEENLLTPWRDWCNALEHVGLNQERRPLVLKPISPSYQWLAADHLQLSFTLDAGAFATAILRELFVLDNQQLPEPE